MAQVIQALPQSTTGQPISPALHDRHAVALRVVRLMFVELDEIVADGDEVSDAEWARWSMEWSSEMGTLLELVRARDAGQLTLYQEVLLGDILVLLERERPRLATLRLAGPVILTPDKAS